MAKVITPQQLENRLKTERRVIFTHGTFDLFHIGHLSLLRRAKDLGSILVVGVDSDAHAELYKRKPIMEQAHRVGMIAHLGWIDYVVPLDANVTREDVDSFFLNLYLMLKPDVITHGVRFTYRQEVEAKCRRVGVKVKFIKHQWSEVSTTRYINSIVSQYGAARI